ncbi:Electron transport protein SCO1/SenC (fragment), partial [Pseudomonas inefficax]
MGAGLPAMGGSAAPNTVIDEDRIMSGSWRFLLVLSLFAASIPYWPLQPQQPVAEEAATPWGANYFPNIPLLTQDGEKVHFFDDLIKDKVVAINFIFT